MWGFGVGFADGGGGAAFAAVEAGPYEVGIGFVAGLEAFEDVTVGEGAALGRCIG